VCVCRISMRCGTLRTALSTQCLFHSRTPLNGLYFERTLCLLRAKRCGVSKLFFASLSSSSRAPCCDALVGRLFNGGGGGGGGHGCVGGKVCSSVVSFGSSPQCSLSLIMPTSARIHANHIFHTHLQHVANTQSYWYRHKGARRRSTDYGPQALEQVRDLTLRPVVPRLGVRVCACVCVCVCACVRVSEVVVCFALCLRVLVEPSRML
jgi:hypothetical protein